MSEESDERRTRRRAVWPIVIVLFVLLVLYPLSMGPMSVIHNNSGPRVQVALRTIYVPLALLCAKTGTDEVAEKYMDWWNSHFNR